MNTVHIMRSDEHPGVALLGLDNPPLNTLEIPTWTAMLQAAIELRTASDIHSVVFHGSSSHFSAGGDARDILESSPNTFREVNRTLQLAFQMLAELPQITIAAIRGFALGGGLEWALAADFRYISDTARIGLPEIKLGILPGSGGTQRLPRLIGPSRAKELILTGRIVGPEEALSLGLADRLVPDDQLDTLAIEAASAFARGPYAQRLAKRAIDAGLEMSIDGGLVLEAELIAEAFRTNDARLGLEAFLADKGDTTQFQGA